MTLYGLQRAMYEYLNPTGHFPGVAELSPEELRARFSLSDEELAALVDVDVRALSRLGVHPVLLNSYGRDRLTNSVYRAALAEMRKEREAAEVP